MALTQEDQALIPADITDQQKQWLEQACICSEFFRDQLRKQPEWGHVWLEKMQDIGDVEQDLAERFGSIAEQEEASRTIRQWRHFHQCLFILLEVNQLITEEKLTAACTAVAEAAVRVSLGWLQPRLEERLGVPAEDPFKPGQPQTLTVIAMGKMGAEELNLSSDIDLIFAFPEEGLTKGGREVTHTDFFLRLGRQLVQLLDTHDIDGFVYRVDMRLRPWGQSGPLACTFRFMKKYYQEQGRDWERFALIKGRVIAGSKEAGEHLTGILQDFVYRRYVDYQALQVLREMKKMIIRENNKQGRSDNIKLGEGGIREIEFIAQAIQLIQGGKDLKLRRPNIWHIFQCMRDDSVLPEAVINELEQYYNFLRQTEHCLQAWQDRQTQQLPPSADQASWARLATAMGRESGDALRQEINQVREQVSDHFNAFIKMETDQNQEEDSHWLQVWQGSITDHLLAADCYKLVHEFRQSGPVTRMQDAGRQRLDAFMAIALKELVAFKNAEKVWLRLQPLLEAVLRRTAYLVLLTEHPAALRHVLRVLALSPWVAEKLANNPYLLDEFTDSDNLYKLHDRLDLSEALHQRLIGLPEEDEEQQMETLRHFRHGWVMRAAACELNQALPLMKISDYLAYTAEVVIDQSFWLAWRQLTSRFGRPMKTVDEACNPGFAIIGYGKLGGLELSYESDLDLVFLHHASNNLSTEGPKVVDNSTFFLRLGQKLIHILNTRTQSGDLYEVDMRLRPSGNKGMLVSSVPAFEKYQHKEAWTWEHQALVRARFIAGDPELKDEFNQVRHDVLCLPRDVSELQQKVVEMREKMRTHLGTKTKELQNSQLNLKQDPGGIVDIEFLVQFGVLAWASAYPELTRWSDNVRLIGSLRDCGFFTESEANNLLDAYLAFREKAHFAMLHKKSVAKLTGDAINDLASHRSKVITVWQEIMQQPARIPE